MEIQESYQLTEIINAAGTFTPLGVSRSSPEVARISAQALTEFFIMDELQDVASHSIADWCGAEAGTITHCVSAAIVLAVAAAMTGHSTDAIAKLPDTKGLRNRVVLPAGHAVNYGHPILQDVRMAGATPVLAGSDNHCSTEDLKEQLDNDSVACLLLVSSRLVSGEPVDLTKAVAAAHAQGLPAIIDGAAQDMRIDDLLETGADLILVSAHKYLASPTAGLVIGKKAMVDAVRAQGKGIGRSMKASKEAICGVLAAISERQKMDISAWRDQQQEKVDLFVQQANKLPGIKASLQPDPAGMPFSRVQLAVENNGAGLSAESVAAELRLGHPSIWVMTHALSKGCVILELVPLNNDELGQIISRLLEILESFSG